MTGETEALDAKWLLDRTERILSADRVGPAEGRKIGESREGRPIRAFRFGRGDFRVSLLGGCHADEPVGPRFLRHLAGYLGRLEETSAGDPLLDEIEWWVLPHLNPDGEAVNRAWFDDEDEHVDPAAYLFRMEREAPGDDMEFCFPRDPDDAGARPENRAVAAWWREAGGGFRVHASLHGMALGAGPWFLVEPEWRERCDRLKEICARRTRELGYELHDVERRGEKGFFRIDRGFATRPDSTLMRSYFLSRGDTETARLFRPSSMETVRSLSAEAAGDGNGERSGNTSPDRDASPSEDASPSGDTLTLVSEMPLFIAPGIGVELGPPDPEAEWWRSHAEEWHAELVTAGESGDPSELAETARRIRREAEREGLEPMPVSDQMELQWTLIAAGIEQAGIEAARSERTG